MSLLLSEGKSDCVDAASELGSCETDIGAAAAKDYFVRIAADQLVLVQPSASQRKTGNLMSGGEH